MILTKEEFEKKRDEVKALSYHDAILIENIIPLDQIVLYINKESFSNRCKKNLLEYLNLVKNLYTKWPKGTQSVMIVSDENIDKIRNVLISILLGHELYSNILCPEVSLSNILENNFGLNNCCLELRCDIDGRDQKEQINFLKKFPLNTICFFSADSQILKEYPAGYSPLIPITIEDIYSYEEKTQHLSSLCLEYGFKLDIDIKQENSVFSTESLNALKAQMTQIIMQTIMKGETNNTIKVSELLNKLSLTETEKSSRSRKRDTGTITFGVDGIVELEIEEAQNEPSSKKVLLDDLIGLNDIKVQIKRIGKYFKKNDKNISSRHMVFAGNPGTGKTSVARCLQQELYSSGVLKKDIFIEADRSGLCANYVGQTATKTTALFEKAKGGLLFIDEAYALSSIADENKFDYGYEAITTLVKLMEDNRDSTIVIFAGYAKEMEQFIKQNPGLSSRIQFHFMFPDYSVEELKMIFQGVLDSNNYTITKEAMDKLGIKFKRDRELPNFANGRYVRNVAEKLMLIQCDSSDESMEISLRDVNQFIKEEPNQEERKCIGF